MLTVRRKAEWKGLDVYYEVELCVRKKMNLSSKELRDQASHIG